MCSRRQPEFITCTLVLLDLLMINTIAVVLHLLMTYINAHQQLILLLAINIPWFITAFLLRSYRISNLMTFGTIANNIFIASFVNMTVVTFIYCYVA